MILRHGTESKVLPKDTKHFLTRSTSQDDEVKDNVRLFLQLFSKK